MADKPIALVTGASKGIGKAIVEALLADGYDVIGTSRNPDTMNDGDKVEGVRYLPLDLVDETSIEKLIESAGEIDVLINNAGASQCGPVEEVPIEQVKRLFQLNLFGNIRLIQGFLPPMREKRNGAIINVTSMAARTPVPFSTFYASSKAAFEAFSRGLRSEVMHYGIKVVIVSPFHIKTDIPQEMCINEGSPYEDRALRVKGIRDVNLQEHSPGPEVVAKKVMQVLKMKNPKPDYAAGDNATLMSHLIRYMPRRMVEKNVRKRFKLDHSESE